MDNNLLSLSKVFSERIFRIPDYQRGYAWSEPQLTDFWSDLSDITTNSHYTGVVTLEPVPPKAYASWEDDLWIIESKKFAPYYVVDGQQRLTTSLILIQVLLEACASKGITEINFQPVSLIRKQYIYDTKGAEGISGSSVFGYERDNPSYELFLKSEIFGIESKNHHPTERTLYTSNLAFAKEFLERRVSMLDKHLLEEAFRRVTQSLAFNVFTISDEVEVSVAFETMNNRGKRLTTLELLKNRLIYLTTRMDLGHRERGSLRKAINETWKSIYHYLGKSEELTLDDDQFLRTHFTLFFGARLWDISRQAVEEESPEDTGSEDTGLSPSVFRYLGTVDIEYDRFLLTQLFTPENLDESVVADRTSSAFPVPTDTATHPRRIRRFNARTRIHRTLREPVDLSYLTKFSASLKRSVKTWYELMVESRSAGSKSDLAMQWMGRINRLYESSRISRSPTRPDIYALCLAIASAEATDEQRGQALSVLERWLFISLFLGPRVGFPRRYLLSMAARLWSGATELDEVKAKLSNSLGSRTGLRHTEIQESIRQSFRKKHGGYRWSGLRYFLYEYDSELRGASKSSHDVLSWDLLVDPPLDPDYISVEHIYPQRPNAQYWRRRFGGHAFTSKQRSQLRHSLGNLVALSKPKNSSLSNRSFPDKIKHPDGHPIGFLYGSYAEAEVASYTEWTAESILKRGLALLAFMEKRWALDLGSRATKSDILGLGWLQPEAPA